MSTEELKDATNELGFSKITEDAVQKSQMMFFEGIKRIKNSGLSAKSQMRCLEYALNDGLSDKVIKLRTDDEKQVAFIYKLVLESMLILKAAQLKVSDHKLNEGEEDVGTEENT